MSGFRKPTDMRVMIPPPDTQGSPARRTDMSYERSHSTSEYGQSNISLLLQSYNDPGRLQQYYRNFVTTNSSQPRTTFQYMAGFLLLQHKDFHETWDRKWFVLLEGTLYYFAEKVSPKDGQEEIDIITARQKCEHAIQLEDVTAVVTSSGHGEGTFFIETVQDKYHVRAENRELMNEWKFAFHASVNVVANRMRFRDYNKGLITPHRKHHTRLFRAPTVERDVQRPNSPDFFQSAFRASHGAVSDVFGPSPVGNFLQQQLMGDIESCRKMLLEQAQQFTAAIPSASPTSLPPPPPSPLPPIPPPPSFLATSPFSGLPPSASSLSNRQSTSSILAASSSLRSTDSGDRYRGLLSTPTAIAGGTGTRHHPDNRASLTASSSSLGSQSSLLGGPPRVSSTPMSIPTASLSSKSPQDWPESKKLSSLSLGSHSSSFRSADKGLAARSPGAIRDESRGAMLSSSVPSTEEKHSPALSGQSSVPTSPDRSLRFSFDEEEREEEGSDEEVAELGCRNRSSSLLGSAVHSLSFSSATAKPSAIFRSNRDDPDADMTKGTDSFGVTSLKGNREKMEDVHCCIPDYTSFSGSSTLTQGLGKDSTIHSFYAIFDGHAGRRAALFSEERLAKYTALHPSYLSDPVLAVQESVKRIDREFCKLAGEEDLYDGTTAVAFIRRGNKLLFANIGDSAAVLCVQGKAVTVTDAQTPGREDERARIERGGGWVTEERELQMARLHTMDLDDPVILQMAKEVVRWVSIFRVNGELAVSRSIGDPDYKGDGLQKYPWLFPDNKVVDFTEDMVICDPEFQEHTLTPATRFAVIACDGLWDVMNPQNVVDFVTSGFDQKKQTAMEVSRELAHLAVRLGSSDNVSVIVIRFDLTEK